MFCVCWDAVAHCLVAEVDWVTKLNSSGQKYAILYNVINYHFYDMSVLRSVFKSIHFILYRYIVMI